MKAITIMISSLMCAAILSAAAFSAAESSYILGDADGNGAVDIADATWIRRIIIKDDIPFTVKPILADTDGDGDISPIDATLIQRCLAGLRSNSCIGKPISEIPLPSQDEYELPIVR